MLHKTPWMVGGGYIIHKSSLASCVRVWLARLTQDISESYNSVFFWLCLETTVSNPKNSVGWRWTSLSLFTKAVNEETQLPIK